MPRRHLEIVRRLAATRPDAFDGILASLLGNRSLVGIHLGDPAGARECAAEAVRLLEARSGARSAGLQAELLWTLAMHGWSLLELGDLDAALGPVERACALADAIRVARPAAVPMQTALAYWLGWRCAVALGDSGSAAHRVGQALGVLNHWVEQGAVALPAHLLAPAAELLSAVDEQPANADRFPALRRPLAGT